MVAPRPDMHAQNAGSDKDTQDAGPDANAAPDGDESGDAPDMPPMTEDPDKNNYKVVVPSVGVTVPYLPDDAKV